MYSNIPDNVKEFSDQFQTAQHPSDWILAGDSSEQMSLDQKYTIYSIIALHKDDYKKFCQCLSEKVNKYLPANVNWEIHTKDIWNGSSRKKTVFDIFENKDEMKHFFLDLLSSILHLRYFSVAACIPPYRNEVLLKKNEKQVGLKATAVYAALSRLDKNIHIATGKHIYSAPFYTDPEAERMMRTVSKNLVGLLAEVEPIFRFDPNNPQFIRVIDPIYIPTQSHKNLLIQIADVIAYFTGKHLTLFNTIEAQVIKSQAVSSELYKKIEDSNFSLSILQFFDVEVVAFVELPQTNISPYWVKRAIQRYKSLIDLGFNTANLSIRECLAVSHNKKEVLVGTGYLNIASLI